uniref:Uncharacterized protein n=1 Tax=Trichogramma kaykai TaxID=54128 RepID=A0ABD2XEM1_9HYME
MPRLYRCLYSLDIVNEYNQFFDRKILMIATSRSLVLRSLPTTPGSGSLFELSSPSSFCDRSSNHLPNFSIISFLNCKF